MKRLTLVVAVALVLGFALLSVAQAAAPKDPLGVVTIKKGQPVHVAYWMVVAGADASLGIDTRRGVELAIADKGAKLLGPPDQAERAGRGLQRRGRPGRRHEARLRPDDRRRDRLQLLERRAPRGAHPVEGRHPDGVALQHRAVSDRPETRQGVRRLHAHRPQRQGAGRGRRAVRHQEAGRKNAATIHDGSVYAEQLQAVFAEKFKKLGGTIIAQEAVAPTDTDMRPVLTKIATGKPDFIYLPIFIAAAGHITRQSKEVAGLEKVALMSADGSFSPDFYKAAGEAAVGMYHSSPDFSAFGAGLQGLPGQAPEEVRGEADRAVPRARLRRGHDGLRGRREGRREGRRTPCTSRARPSATPSTPPRARRA